MARNPGNADKLMLEAAKEIICRDGCSGLRIRDVAERAGVNLGMFHYHFESKEHFKRLALQEIYEVFFDKLSRASKEGATALDQLRNTLFAIGCFVRDEREFYLAVFKDILNDDFDVFQFFGENMPRHASLIKGLLKKCQEEGSMIEIHHAQAMPIVMGTVNFPILIAGAIERRCKSGKGVGKGKGFTIAKDHFQYPLSDRAISQRIDIILKGLAP
jgi:AcrR family transcriptional regulator